GDGMPDYAEFKARTDLNDPESNLAIASVEFNTQGDAVISWRSAPEVSYRLEVANGNIMQGPLFSGVGQVMTATNSWMRVVIPQDSFSEEGLIRISLAE
ncbi:MAG: hypothetical protein V2A34_02985, partial [Lentisphaerota bacterium]